MEVDGILTKTCGCIQPFYYEGELWRSGENGLFLVAGSEGDLNVGEEKKSWNMPVRPVITVKIKLNSKLAKNDLKCLIFLKNRYIII